MRFDIVTIFPQIFTGYLDHGPLKRAIEDGSIDVHLHNLRDWTTDAEPLLEHRGPRKVLRAGPIAHCVADIHLDDEHADHVVMLSPRGRMLDQDAVEELARLDRVVLLCGRLGGFEDQLFDMLQPDEISVGDYVLNGGESAAIVFIDAIMRLVPGVLDAQRSKSKKVKSHSESRNITLTTHSSTNLIF